MAKKIAKKDAARAATRKPAMSETSQESEDSLASLAGPELPPMPRSRDELRAWLRSVLNISVPARPMIEGHATPLDYLSFAFFEDALTPRVHDPAATPTPTPTRDCVVWANRGGGKTFLGALATLLDLLHKPGIEIRILGGSLDQSRRMHAHLRRLVGERGHPAIASQVAKLTESRLALRNGSEVELLAQSHTSVRGTRVQKLRCDEVDLFKPDVWEAAQLTTRSATLGGIHVCGSVECLSTMHLPHGVMHTLVREARDGRRKLFRWGVVDVLAACGDEHSCGHDKPTDANATECRATAIEIARTEPRDTSTTSNTNDATDSDRAIHITPPLLPTRCALWGECRGRAKKREAAEAGHVDVADALAMKRRVPEAVWKAEMLCVRARRSDSVLPEFDPALHVITSTSGPGFVASAAAAHARGVLDASLSRTPLRWVVGMDFGIRGDTAILWGVIDENKTLYIVDERIVADEPLTEHIAHITKGLARSGVDWVTDTTGWPSPSFVAIDPAGLARDQQSGVSNAELLRKAGFSVKARRGRIHPGLVLLRARLAPASGESPRLFIHERCTRLIESIERYHYPPGDRETIEPVKGEGWDHGVDALRYLIQNLDAPTQATTTNYTE